MKTLESLLSGPLFEESAENVKGWDKETIQYATENKGKVCKQIRSISKTRRKMSIQTADVEDIYEEILMYLYNCDDYNINKAIDRSSSGNIVTLEGYVNVCIKYCVIRHCSTLNGDKGLDVISENIVTGDSKDLSILDNVADKSSEIDIDDFDCDFNTICKSCAPIRYRYGADMFLVLYVRVLADFDLKGEIYKTILSILGITKRELSRIERESDNEIMTSMVKSMNKADKPEIVSILEKYVYSYRLVKQMVLSYS